MNLGIAQTAIAKIRLTNASSQTTSTDFIKRLFKKVKFKAFKFRIFEKICELFKPAKRFM